MKFIELQPKKFNYSFIILLDDDDFDKLNKYQWKVTQRSKNGTFYVYTTINGQRKLMHRMIMDTKPDEVVHHINQIGLDNRKENLKNLNQKNHFKIHHKNPFIKRTTIYQTCCKPPAKQPVIIETEDQKTELKEEKNKSQFLFTTISFTCSEI